MSDEMKPPTCALCSSDPFEEFIKSVLSGDFWLCKKHTQDLDAIKFAPIDNTDAILAWAEVVKKQMEEE